MEALKWAWRNQQIRMLVHPSSTGLSLQRLSDVVCHTKPFWFQCPLYFPHVSVGFPHQVHMPEPPFVLPPCYMPTPDDLPNMVW